MLGAGFQGMGGVGGGGTGGAAGEADPVSPPPYSSGQQVHCVVGDYDSL